MICHFIAAMKQSTKALILLSSFESINVFNPGFDNCKILQSKWGTHNSSGQLSGCSMRLPCSKCDSISSGCTPGYGDPPKVMISNIKMPKDQLKSEDFHIVLVKLRHLRQLYKGKASSILLISQYWLVWASPKTHIHVRLGREFVEANRLGWHPLYWQPATLAFVVVCSVAIDVAAQAKIANFRRRALVHEHVTRGNIAVQKAFCAEIFLNDQVQWESGTVERRYYTDA